MHSPQPPMGGDTANLLYSSQAVISTAAAAATAAASSQTVLALLLQPVWRAEHLKVLRVRERTEVSAATIVGKFNLPRDGHDDFEELSSELTQPTPTDILNFTTTKDTYRLNLFCPAFSELHSISHFTTDQSSSQSRYTYAAKNLVRNLIETIMPYADDEGSLRIDLNSVPFYLKRICVKGILACDGCIIRTDMEGRQSPLPVAAFSIVRPKDNEDVEAQEASQLVLQAALAYEQNPDRNVYKVFAIHVNGMRLQVVAAEIPRLYLERLYQGKACPEGFEVLHSASYDMLEVDGRREALRIIFGLLRSLRSTPVRRSF